MSIQHTIKNYKYDANIIVTNLQQSIKDCQSERDYFENISRNVNDCNNTVYNKLRVIQTILQQTKAKYKVIDNYHHKVVNFKAEVDTITNTINTAISNYKSECINFNSI